MRQGDDTDHIPDARHILERRSRLGMITKTAAVPSSRVGIPANHYEKGAPIKRIKSAMEIEAMPLPRGFAAARMMDDVIELPDFRPRWPSGRLLAIVASVAMIDMADLLGESRRAHITEARQIAMWILHRFTPLSLPEIGKRMNRDHTTVLHGIRRVDEIIPLINDGGDSPVAWVKAISRHKWSYGGTGRRGLSDYLMTQKMAGECERHSTRPSTAREGENRHD